jgi:hypothetical protein
MVALRLYGVQLITRAKGKIESGVKYVRRNFVCGLLGREPACLMDTGCMGPPTSR